METQGLKEGITISGVVTVRRHPARTIDCLKALHTAGKHDEAQELFKTGEIAVRQKNIIVDSTNCGIDLLIQWLVSGLNTVMAYPIGPQWGEIGTGTTTPTLADVALQTPTLREPLSYAADVSFNQAQLQFFFPDASLPNGTYREFGTFVSTLSTPLGSGQMFNHALFGSPYSKSSGNDTTVEVDISISN